MTPDPQALRRLLAGQHSPLPWSHDLAAYSTCMHGITAGERGDVVAEMHADDAALVVAAVNAAPGLLARVAELEAEVARLRAERDARLGTALGCGGAP